MENFIVKIQESQTEWFFVTVSATSQSEAISKAKVKFTCGRYFYCLGYVYASI